MNLTKWARWCVCVGTQLVPRCVIWLNRQYVNLHINLEWRACIIAYSKLTHSSSHIAPQTGHNKWGFPNFFQVWLLSRGTFCVRVLYANCLGQSAPVICVLESGRSAWCPEVLTVEQDFSLADLKFGCIGYKGYSMKHIDFAIGFSKCLCRLAEKASCDWLRHLWQNNNTK